MEEKSNPIERVVPDTSILIEGLLSDKINNNEIKANGIIIHEAVLAELEHQANMGKSIGFVGLEEITRLRSEIGIIQRVLDNKKETPIPIIFVANCDKCGKATTHVSHIASKVGIPKSDFPMAATTMITNMYDINKIPIRTCLECGFTYSDQRLEVRS